MTRLDTRRLRQFISVAQHLSFSHAAEVLNTSQPSLSQHIRSLEHELGFKLFERTKRRVRLTTAGAEYLAGIQGILEELDRCAQRGRDAQRGVRGTLAIATVGVAMFTHLPPLVRQFQQQYPNLTVRISVLPNAEIVHVLRAKYADLIFATHVEANEEIATEQLWPMPWRVVLPIDHPQAKKRAVKLGELFRDTLFIQPHSEVGLGGHEAVLTLCRDHGLTPREIREVTGASATQTLIGLVACGLGVALVPSAYEQIKLPSIIFRPIRPESNGLQICASWRSADTNLLIQNFLEIARKATS